MSRVRIVALGLVGLASLAWSAPAFAQAPVPPADVRPGFSFNLAPYVWLPTINSSLHYPVRGGGTADTTLSADPGDYIPHLNFATALAGEVRYDRFSVFSDFMYVNASTSAGRITSFEPLLPSSPIQRVLDSNLSLRMSTALWTVAGGYQLISSPWADVDVFAGVRLLSISTKTNYNLAATITRPDRSIALDTSGSLTSSVDVWNGIAGVRGRFYLGDSTFLGGGKFFVPFYVDVGGGGSNLTWQASSGVGYQTKSFSLSVGYRYLDFQQASDSIVPKLSLGGPIILASFTF